ncbi:MAG: ABC transporter permease [Patescibacteria group bacterium]
MTAKHVFAAALKGVEAHKSRSVLTILGIVIGITAIILVMSLGQGAQDAILAELRGIGSKTIVVIPGREPKGPSDFAQLFSDSLKERDLEAIRRKENVPTLRDVIPLVFGAETASYEGETYRPTIMGSSEHISELFLLDIVDGRFFTEDEVKSRADSIVLGSKVKTELFGESDALGKKIKIKGKNFRVIGIMPSKGQVSFFNFDDAALVPYTTAQQHIFGIKHFHRFIAEAETETDIKRTVRDLELTLRNMHGISNKEKKDFFIQTQEDLAASIGTITNVLTLLLVSIAAISLVVGGIGIMNIMLVSVTERTREIGLRKALGATDKDILQQFLTEAVILTAAGGIIGILLGALLSLGASFAIASFLGIEWNFSFPFFAVFIGITVSAAIGLIFGIYPARQASKKSPIEALRYE